LRRKGEKEIQKPTKAQKIERKEDLSKVYIDEEKGLKGRVQVNGKG